MLGRPQLMYWSWRSRWCVIIVWLTFCRVLFLGCPRELYVMTSVWEPCVDLCYWVVFVS